jgi:hypothetical protein
MDLGALSDLGMLSVLVVVVALTLYAFVIGLFTKGIATWTVAVLRPLLVMCVFAPGIVLGHGLGIAPMAMVVGYELLHPRPGEMLSWNLTNWLICASAAFLFECTLAFWRRRRSRQV